MIERSVFPSKAHASSLFLARAQRWGYPLGMVAALLFNLQSKGFTFWISLGQQQLDRTVLRQSGEAQRQGLFVGLPRTNPTWRSQMKSKWMNFIFKSGESTFGLTCASLAFKTYHSLAYLPSKHTTVSAMPYPRSSLATRGEALGSLDAAASSNPSGCVSFSGHQHRLIRQSCLPKVMLICPHWFMGVAKACNTLVTSWLHARRTMLG